MERRDVALDESFCEAFGWLPCCSSVGWDGSGWINPRPFSLAVLVVGRILLLCHDSLSLDLSIERLTRA